MEISSHTSPEIAMTFFAVRSDGLLRSLGPARSKPRHVVGHPSESSVTLRTRSGGVLDSLLVIHPELEMFCHAMPNRASVNSLDRQHQLPHQTATRRTKLVTP